MSYLSSLLLKHQGTGKFGQPFGVDLKQIYLSIDYYIAKFRGKFKHFTFNNQHYSYFYHQYNVTWTNERCVEIPICFPYLQKYRSKQIMELGNVLSHYFDTDHQVIDKYEKAPNVINQDIVSFKPQAKYDLILSISTLEHIGWDEKKDPQKTKKTVNKLRSFLKPKGVGIITFPIGYNPHLDKYLFSDQLGLVDCRYLKRISSMNNWIEVDKEEVINEKYGHPFPCANAIAVAHINSLE